MIGEIILSAILGSIFLWSTGTKLHHPKGFLLAVVEYRLLSPALSKLYGLVLPPLEFLLALLALGGMVVRLAALGMSLLLGSFIVAISVNVLRGREIDCGCFGQSNHRKTGRDLLLQDMVLLGMSIALAIATPSWGGLESWSVFSLLSMKPALAIMVVGIGSMLYLMFFLSRAAPEKRGVFMKTRDDHSSLLRIWFVAKGEQQ